MSQAVKVGLFVTLALVILGYLIFEIEDLSLFGGKGTGYQAVFDSVVGLDDKAPVRVAGVRVGSVDGIGLDGRKARVEIRLDEPVPLTEGAYAEIANAGILGDKYVELYLGEPGAPLLPPGSVLPGRTPVTFDEALGKLSEVGDSLKDFSIDLGGGEFGDSLGRLVTNLEEASAGVRDLIASNRLQIDGTIRNFERFSGTLAVELPKISEQMQRVLGQVEVVVAENRPELEGSLRGIRELTERLQTSVDNLNSISSQIASGEGSLGKLVYDDAAHDGLVSTLASVEEGVTSLSDTLGRVQRLQLDVGLEAGYLSEHEESRSALRLDLQARDDRFYRVELVDDPRGKVREETEVITVTNPDGSTETTTIATRTIEDKFTVSAQFGFRFGAATARLGLFESTGGGAVDYDLLDDQLRLSLEAYDFSREEDEPRLRLLGRYLLHPNVYVVGGLDDLLLEDNASLFLGAGVRWRDDDLKYLLGSIPTGGL